jgi:hypothetical protein
MDLTVLHAIWFDCPDLSDTAHKLLLALAYHGNPCWPAVERLATMIRRSERQTQYLLRQLEQEGYITVKKGRGRSKSSTYTIKVQPGLHPSEKRCNLDFVEKVQPELRPLEKRCNLDFAEKVQSGLHPNSYLEQDIKNAHARGEEDGKKDDDDFCKGVRYLTPGSLAHQHANGTSSPL